VTRAAEKPAPSSYRRIQAAGIALLAALALLILAEPPWNLRLQAAWFDTYQLLVPRTIKTMPMTVVEIDEKSIDRLGQWPWPRNVLAKLVRNIEAFGPAAIGLDILMSERDRMSLDRSSDRELAQAIAAGPVVVGLAGRPERTDKEPEGPPFIVVDRAKSGHPPSVEGLNVPSHAGALTNIEELDRAASGHGALSAGPSDSVIRRLPLAIRINDRLVPSMPIEMLRVSLGAGEIRLFSHGGSVDTIAVGHFVAPTEADGELRIYYSKRDPRRYVSAIDVLDGKFDPDQLENKLVLIGTTGLAMVDYQNTPLGERMPGSEIHAQLLENINDQTWLIRPSWAPWLELGVFVLLGLSLVWATPRWKPASAALLAVFAIALPIAAGFAAFVWRRLVFDAAAPSLGLLVLFSALLLLTLAEAGRQRRRLERVIQRQREQAAYISGEVEAAKRVQMGFLPKTDALAGERRVEIAATMTPAREVGGDLYDFFLIDGRRLFFMIGDVAGKGLSASMFMAVSKALYKSNALRNLGSDMGELMRAANVEVSRDNPEMFFVTAFAAVLDLESGALAYCSAGHEGPYVLGPSGAEISRLAEAAGPPLCTVDGFAYRGAEHRLQPGQTLCLVTDGVIDARNPQAERYGSGRLRALLANLPGGVRAAQAVLDAVCNDVRAFVAGADAVDDLSVLAVRWIGPR